MAGASTAAILVADLVRTGERPGWRDAVADHGGHELGGANEELSLAFSNVLAALSCAKAVQRACDRATGRPGVRVGIDAGNEQTHVASGLCRRAERGQVLVSPAARALAVSRGGHEFRELAPVELGGLREAVRAWELLWREPEPRTWIRLCGGLALEIDGRQQAGTLPGGQAGSLLCYLIASDERAADRDEMIDVIWPERPPRDPQAALRPILSRLRRAIAPATLEGRERLRLALPEPVWVDVEQATRAVENARAAAKTADWESAADESGAALELLRPGFLPGHQGDWVDARRRELREFELEALEWQARSALALGGDELGAAERASRELIARSPYRETGHRFLMEALAGSGNVAEALRAYEDLRVLLREELGATPAPEVQALHQRLLVADGADAPPLLSSPETGAPGLIQLPGLLSPCERSAFVGREHELGVLRAAWERARSGSRRLVMIAGEPGIGKTRLASEFALEAHGDGTVLYAGCQEEALVSYQPFIEALRHYGRSAGLEWAGAAAGPGAGELARLIPELAAALPAAKAAPDDAETRRYLLFDAVSAILAEVSARSPLLLVLDDVHWADRATLDLLRYVLRAPREASLLIVGSYREGEIGGEHPLAELLADLRRDRLIERVSLEGLDEGGVGTLIASHAGHEAPFGLVATVHEHTEGNPFFVEEVMRHLIETGMLFERGGRWVSALTPDEIGVPEGVKEVLASRMGRLSDGCRAALSQAAVLGREFDFEVLRAMAESDEDALIAVLEEAVAAQLVVEAQGRAGPAYAFTHALVRETLYGGVSAPRRQRMHARAARAIEQVDAEGPVAVLAGHHRLAGSAGDPAKAIDYSLRAGAQAREVSAWEEAAAHWEGALAVMARTGGHESERAGLLVALAELMVVVGDLGRQIDYLEGALALYEGSGDAERAAQVHSRLGMACSLIDSIYAEHLDIGRAFRHYDAARAVLEQGPPRKARGHLETGVSTALTYGLRIEEGIGAATRALEIAERLGDEVLWAAAAEAYAWHRLVAGDLQEGFRALDRAFEVADREQRPVLAWMGSNIRGQLTWGLGAPDEARAFFERALRLPYVGKTAYRQEIADGIGRCHASKGETEEARRLLSDAKPAWITHSLKPLLDLWEGSWAQVESLAARVLETSRRTGNRWDEWAAHHLAARAHYLRGDLEPAGERLERALSIVVDGGAPYFELWVRPDLARVRADGGRRDEARGHVDRCREITSRGDDWRGRAGHVDLAEAVVLALDERMDRAEAMFVRARETFGRYRLRGDEADALQQWGRALAHADDDAAASDKLDEALEIYRRHGAGVAWLDRVEVDRRALRQASR
jgi:DNA-binding SARP family transcriptional activator/tetratricopeptide (TPR) repeat protein